MEKPPLNSLRNSHLLHRNEVRDICNAFNHRLKLLISGQNRNFAPFELGYPSAELASSGIPDLPIQMSVQRLVDKKLQSNHPFSLSSVAHMPEYLANPVAVFQSKTRQECKVILTEMEEKAVNIVVVVEINRQSGQVSVNSVRSVYPKDNVRDIFNWIAVDRLMAYCHKEKILNWFSKQQSNSADVTKLIKDCTNIVQKI